MVARQRRAHGLGHRQLTVAHDRPILDRGDGEDRRLRRIDHRDQLLDVEHADVREAEGAAGQLRAAELAAARLLGQLAGARDDLAERQRLGAVQHRHDEAVLDGHGDADVDVVVQLDAAVAATTR